MSTARFENARVLVTGAASGLGRVTALRFAAEGAAVAVVDLNSEGLDETVELSDGMITTAVSADVSSRDAAHAAVADVVAGLGGLDILVNVAGVLRNGHFVEMTEADAQLVIGVNLMGTMWMCQAATPHLVESNGNIVNIASNAGLMGQAYHAVYCASKAAVINLTRSLTMELVKTKVRVNAVAPGGIKTPMSRAVVFPDDVDWELVKPYMGFRRMSRPEEIAEVVMFVASPAASAMTGSIVSTDSGLTAG